MLEIQLFLVAPFASTFYGLEMETEQGDWTKKKNQNYFEKNYLARNSLRRPYIAPRHLTRFQNRLEFFGVAGPTWPIFHKKYRKYRKLPKTRCALNYKLYAVLRTDEPPHPTPSVAVFAVFFAFELEANSEFCWLHEGPMSYVHGTLFNK